MNLSGFTHLINIQQKTQTQDPVSGAIVDSWSNVSFNGVEDIFCGIEPLSVKDLIQSQAHQSDVSVRVKINYLPGIDATMRFVGICGCHSGKIYNPAGVLEDPESGQEWITFPCSQGVNTG